MISGAAAAVGRKRRHRTLLAPASCWAGGRRRHRNGLATQLARGISNSLEAERAELYLPCSKFACSMIICRVLGWSIC